MNNSMNPNISKEFRKRIDLINKWRKGKNPRVTVVAHIYKNSDGKETNTYQRGPSNEFWGKPDSFRMK